jgi:hypothetical protein
MSLPDINSTDFLITNFFGFGASDPTYINLPIPYASQIGIDINAASFTDGFPPATMTPENSGGLPFYGQDMNGIIGMVSANCAALAAGAFPQFSAARASPLGGYPEGAIVAMANGEGYWMNVSAGNSNNPDTSPANSSGWQPICAVGEQVVALSSGTHVLTGVEASSPLLAFNGTLTGNVTVIFPEWVGASWTVAAYTAGAFNITLQTAVGANSVALVSAGSGGGYTNAQNVFVDNGGNLWSNNVSTAGLAPIASPAFTGTPTGPTAGATSNTTQLATTAMVQSAITAALTIYAKLASPIFSGAPSVPTASPGTNTTQAASTAFVQAAVGGLPTIRTGTFTCSNAGTSIAFSPAFPSACTGLQLTHANVVNGSNIGFAGFNSLSRTGAVCYASINGMVVNYIATGT